MNIRTPINTFGSLIRRKLGGGEVDAIIDLLPEAVVIADLEKLIIVACNYKATEVTSFTRSELIGLSIESLFVPFDSGPDTLKDIYSNNEQPKQVQLLKRGGVRIPCICKTTCLNSAKSFYLIAFESLAAIEQRQHDIERHELLWHTMEVLSTAPFQPNASEAIKKILEACKNLTGASFLALLRARGDLPLFEVLAQIGETGNIPNQLSPVDLPSLHQRSIWLSGKRPLCSLHRTARALNYSYMASIPIGEANAIIGLLIIGGKNTLDITNLEMIMQIMARYTSSLFQSYSLITHLEQEMELQLKNQYISRLVQGIISEGVITLNSTLTILTMNRAAEMCLGYSSNEVIGQSIQNILIGVQDMQPIFQTVLHGRTYESNEPIKLFRRNGNPFPSDLKLWPIAINDELQNVLILIQDLSEEEEYRSRNQLLEQRALLGEVTASFAHEVRNPINNISTGLQLLAYNLPPDNPNQDNIRRLQHDCERLAELVKSSLSFVRPMEYKLEPIDFSIFLKHTIERMRARLERNNIKHHLQVEETLPLVEGDIRSLEQVFTNLIGNAIEAMDGKEGVIAIKARRINDPGIPTQVEISLSDTGPGIPPEIREHIFEPFFTTKQSGTGLGLAIVKRIITAHKGAIHVKSIPGGTIFTICLPAIRDAKSLNGVV